MMVMKNPYMTRTSSSRKCSSQAILPSRLRIVRLMKNGIAPRDTAKIQMDKMKSLDLESVTFLRRGNLTARRRSMPMAVLVLTDAVTLTTWHPWTTGHMKLENIHVSAIWYASVNGMQNIAIIRSAMARFSKKYLRSVLERLPFVKTMMAIELPTTAAMVVSVYSVIKITPVANGRFFQDISVTLVALLVTFVKLFVTLWILKMIVELSRIPVTFHGESIVCCVTRNSGVRVWDEDRTSADSKDVSIVFSSATLQRNYSSSVTSTG